MAMHNQGRTKLKEECAELIVELCKLDAYPSGNHPDGKGHLIDRIENELGDVLAAAKFVIEELGLDKEKIKARKKKKLATYSKWQRDEG